MTTLERKVSTAREMGYRVSFHTQGNFTMCVLRKPVRGQEGRRLIVGATKRDPNSDTVDIPDRAKETALTRAMDRI